MGAGGWPARFSAEASPAGVSAREADALLQSTSSSLASSDDAALPRQLREAIMSWQKANEKVAATRWATLRKDPKQAATRTRQDLQGIVGQASIDLATQGC